MRKIIAYSFFLIAILQSCVSEKGISFGGIPEYKSNEGYKNLYIVDTFKIDTPIRFFTKNGYEFIMSKKHFDSFRGSEKELFKSDNAFLVGDFPLHIPLTIEKHYEGEDCSKFFILLSETKKDIKTIYSYSRNPDYFILMLVNGAFYNHAFCGIDGPPTIKDKNYKFNYYKIIVPICTKKHQTINCVLPFKSDCL